ncbi:TPA: TIGR03756 family integrating conjugative element protein [Legionella pneumophila]|uniref:TIGR03756 family integrating conjugative element protein n=1 Tax=Legionella pneumophila TaxID=446 RepID=UPI00137500AF|nr:TIGR03756 family integrating conjugative element protein [Legionella pneumophila]HAT9703095.1 TIGR03756 family integrating conjugative element protein [Legionella pneumophila subsp. pneumophila]MDI0469812.1 TIGR03756 family integrating conjugative element protein [Legionella pneumophila]HAT8742764.1 TIGR03756 family integrating conjugative element protein [Legionella pneumophila]HAU1444061.1 TIGR03756 family integrating conjugative element protein [Legionella pneumophila]HBI2978810.1 TIGR03
MTNLSYALESTNPPNPANSFTIAARVLEKIFHNSHYKVIGSCTWAVGHLPPKLVITPAVEQFMPDLIITVSNKPEENPWLEARAIYESSASRTVYQQAYKAATGSELGFGNDSGQTTDQHMNDDRTRIVDVIGSPAGLYRIPYLSHKPETGFGRPYYLAEADAVMDRTEAAELLYMGTHPSLLVTPIGTTFKHWGFEIPRLMRVTQPYNYRASVVAAMHAVDIVTNKNPLHVTKSTTNSCGKNCVVANAIYDPKNQKVIWQEVYPLNRTIHPGDPSDYGLDDEKAGNGNYVFVLWRKYRGCIQRRGKLIHYLSFPKVGHPQKR